MFVLSLICCYFLAFCTFRLMQTNMGSKLFLETSSNQFSGSEGFKNFLSSPRAYANQPMANC